MKLEKAIEIVINMLPYMNYPDLQDKRDAIKLLIEAGKRLKYLRDPSRCVGFKVLPGETEE